MKKPICMLLGLLVLIPSLVFAKASIPAVANLPADLALPSPALERRVWDKRPIKIVLPVNKERLVTFNVPVRVDMPGTLDASVLRTQIVADTDTGTIYWTALKAFTSQRIQVQDIRSGNMYLLDLVASPAAQDDTRIEVTVPQAKATVADDPSPISAANPEPVIQPDYVSLTRMAAQHLYAPERLLTLPEGVYRTPVRQSRNQDLFRGDQIEAIPLIAWRFDDGYITAVKLRNRSYSDVILDPRTLRGHWLTATFQHNLLKAHGSLRDTTAAYLISKWPFEEALHGY